ncbi:MAG: FadR family transcriptional regulator [Peptostreptococcaceae bacterium]|nr:FadR family transcriptional regulator [Peptostreptococcaceae bacterium]
MIKDFQKIKKATISETIIEQIKKMVLDGQLTPGQKLPSERELTEILGVSRSSIREAMRSLSSIGLVDIRSGEGTFLNDNTNLLTDHFQLQCLMKKYSILELVEARKMIEIEIIKLAIVRGNSNDIDYIIERYMETMENKNSPLEFIKADFNFHMAIAEASKNRYLAEMLAATRELLLEINTDVIRKPGQIDKAIITHESIIDAIKSGDIYKAQVQMGSHIDMVAVVMGDIECGNDASCTSKEDLLKTVEH